MKHKRQKHAKKVTTFYEKHFGITPPYNILLDSTFVREALTNKVNIWDQLPKYLCADVRLFTTNCVIKELEAFGKLLYGPLKVMREYKVTPCPHLAHAQDPVDCLRKTAKRSHPDYTGQQTDEEKKKKAKRRQFFVATQHSSLADKINRAPGIPVLYLHGNAINLEKASEESKKAAGVFAQDKLVPEHERNQLETLLEQEGILPVEDGPIHHKKKLKGPNPLAVLKKRKKLMANLNRRERRKWQKVRRRKKGPLGPLAELMMQELLVEDWLGWKGVIYHKKSVSELHEELTCQNSVLSPVSAEVKCVENGSTGV